MSKEQHDKEIAEMRASLAGKDPAEMNDHDLLMYVSLAREDLKAARANIATTMANLPLAAKAAAGDQLRAVHELLEAMAELTLGTSTQVQRAVVKQG